MKIEYITTFAFDDGDKTVDENLTKEELLKIIKYLCEDRQRITEYFERNLRVERLFRKVGI
jgi:hypothetical protein